MRHLSSYTPSCCSDGQGRQPGRPVLCRRWAWRRQPPPRRACSQVQGAFPGRISPCDRNWRQRGRSLCRRRRRWRRSSGGPAAALMIFLTQNMPIPVRLLHCAGSLPFGDEFVPVDAFFQNYVDELSSRSKRAHDPAAGGQGGGSRLPARTGSPLQRISPCDRNSRHWGRSCCHPRRRRRRSSGGPAAVALRSCPL